MSSSGIISNNNGKIFNDLLPNPYPYPAVPSSLAQVLIAGDDAGNGNIENLLQIQTTNVVQQAQIGGHLIIGGTPSNPGSGGDLRIQGATLKGSLLVGDGTSTSGIPVGANGLVLKCNSAQPLGVEWAVDGTSGITGVSAGANININNPNPFIPVISVSNPLDAVLNLGTQNITGSAGSLDFTLGDLTTIIQAGQIINNNTSGAGNAVLTTLQLNISDQAGDVISTLNRDQLVIFNQTLGNEFTATLTKNSLTLTDNAVPATDSMVLTNITLGFTDTGNGAVASLGADAGLVIKPLPITTSGTELTYSKFEMIEDDAVAGTASRLIDTLSNTSYDRQKFINPAGLFTEIETACSATQILSTSEYNDPATTIQNIATNVVNASSSFYRVQFAQPTIPISNFSTIEAGATKAVLYQNINQGGPPNTNFTEIITQSTGFSIYTGKDILFSSQNIDSDGTKLELTTPLGTNSAPMLSLVNTSSNPSASIGTCMIKTNKTGRNATTGDILMSQQFNALNNTGVATTFAKIECQATTATAGDTDGSIDFYTQVGPVNPNLQLVFRLNGADNENNSFRPLDLNGNSLKTSSTNLTIDASTSTGNGVITLATKNGTGALAISGDKTQSNTAGGASGQHLVITLNGVVYKIALLNV